MTLRPPLLAGLAILGVQLGCTDSSRYQSAMCVLMDVSGTYADQKGEVVSSVKAGILPNMLPGDSLFVVLIDSDSYDEENLVTSLKTDRRPLESNAQKMRFAAALDELATSDIRSQFTDISGAMMLCGDYLKNSRAGTKLMFVFSDMKEELPRGITRDFREQEFTGTAMAAINVIKLKGDNARPSDYRGRLDGWEARLKEAGALDWTLILDTTQIPEYIESHR